VELFFFERVIETIVFEKPLLLECSFVHLKKGIPHTGSRAPLYPPAKAFNCTSFSLAKNTYLFTNLVQQVLT
jgi:hypothetical protein